MVTVLFCDVAGYTARGEGLDPEPLRRLQTRYFDDARTTLERHGAVVEKFIGDAVMAVFGIPVLHEDDALRAVRAALELRDAVSALGLQPRVGINTGEVVAGDPGSGQGFVTGDAVNTAKRLEEAAGAGEIIVGDRTWRLVRDTVATEPLEPLSLRGKEQETAAYRVLGLEPGRPDRQRSPLVGREYELGLLQEALAWVVEKRAGHLFTLQGSAGVGKSRLTGEFLNGLGDGARSIRGRCLPYGEGITFWPLAEIVRDAAGLNADEPSESARAKIELLLAGEEHAALIAERISQLIGLSNSLAGGEESFWAVRRFLEALARSGPLVVALDDIQWAEPTFLDLVEHVVDESRDAPILLLCLARPELLELRPAWGTGRMSTTVLLEPLGERESLRLIENALGSALDEDGSRKVLAAAEGNPLFLEEMAAVLLEEGVLAETPPTIQALLAARIDRLDAKERAVLEAASVEGRIFHRGAVTELLGERLRGEVGAQLARLVHKELVWPARSSFADEDAFRFRHLLIRDAAYQSLPKEARAELHERFARWLEERAGQDEVLGYHLERAYRCRVELGPADDRAVSLAARAGEFLGRAGRRAFARDDMPAALTLLDRAVSLVNDQDPARLELVRELSNALWAMGEVARAESLLHGLIEAAGAAGDRRIEWYALLEQAGRRYVSEAAMSADELLDVAESAIQVFEELEDELGLARAWRRMSLVATARCHFGQGEDAALRALDHARAASDAQEEARSIDRLCTCLLYGPTPADEAVSRCLEMLRRVSGNLLMQANIASSLSGLLAMRGRFDDARTAFRRAEEIYESLGLRLPLAGLWGIGGEMELLAGEPVAAEQSLRRAYGTVDPVGATAALFAAQIGRALLAQQRNEEAAELAGTSRDSCGDDIWGRIVCLGLESRVEAWRGESAAALALAEEAVALAEDTDALNLHGDALVDLGHALRSSGRPADAVGAFERARQLYERKGNVAAVGRVAVLLEERV